MTDFLEILWFLVSPAYRREVRRDAGFWKLASAARYILRSRKRLKPGDSEAVALMMDLARDLI